MSLNKEQLYQRTHNWVNKIINEFHPGHGVKKLLPGEIGNSQTCVLANTFAVDGLFDDINVDGDTISLHVGSKSIHIDTPKEIGVFVKSFDAGLYPELVTSGEVPTEESWLQRPTSVEQAWDTYGNRRENALINVEDYDADEYKSYELS